MATMNIKIINPVINYFKEVKEVNTSCESIFTFNIESTPFADVEIAVTPARESGNFPPPEVREVSINLGGGYEQVPFTTNDVNNYPYLTGTYIYRKVVTLNSTGKATVKLVMPNSGVMSYYPKATVYIKDNSNSKEVQRNFNRYNDSSRCISGDAPIAVDDTYTVIKGSQNNILEITANDSQVSELYATQITVKQTPSKGSVTINNSNRTVSYNHAGTDLTSDTFTYTISNTKGESNEATVTINVEENTKVVNNTTKLVIGFDNSGSMDPTLPILQAMVSNELKATLLPYYSSEAEYNSSVFIKNIGLDERFLKFMHENRNETGNTIVLVFMNEAVENYETVTRYHDGTKNDPLRDLYKQDINDLNFILDNYVYDYDGVIFQVNLINDETGETIYHFKDWLTWVKNGEGSYSGKKGLSQQPNVKLSTDVLEGTEVGATSQYYHDKIIQELTNLGFNI